MFISGDTPEKKKKLLQTDGWFLCCIKSKTWDCDIN